MEEKELCGVVQDLLPLYQDNFCSEESKLMVENHLKECETCRKIAERLKNNDVEKQLIGEKKDILLNHARKEKKRTTMIGTITAGVLLIPIVVCLICNLAVGKGLDWFYIVLCSLLVVASITVVPMLKEENCGLWTLSSFVVSLVLLLGVICLYTKGSWFFISTVPTLFGISVLGLPYVLYQLPLPNVFNRSKGLIYMVINSAFLYLVLYVCSFYSTSGSYNRIAYGNATFGMAFVWICFLIGRYLPVSAWTRSGIITILAGFFAPLVDSFVDFTIYGTWSKYLSKVNMLSWNLDQDQIESNVYVIIIIVCVMIGAGFIALGRKKKER